MQFFLYLSTAIEAAAALLIGVAAVRSLVQSIPLLLLRQHESARKQNVRLELGLWLSLALELEVGADILRTAVAPTWNEIGKLVAIVALRTILNYFLSRETRPGRSNSEADSAAKSQL
jgi:uncharacterized membrane protein